LVHGVNLGFFEQPIIAEAANLQGYDDFRNAMVDAGHQLLDRAAAMIPSDVKSVRKINQIGSPAQVILDSAQTVAADIVVVGARGRSRATEAVLGSVSHRVLSHASRPTLIAKGPARPVQRVLVAVEGREDADLIIQWLTRHRFTTPVELCVLNAVVPIGLDSPYDALGARAWWEGAERYAEEFVKATAAKLLDSRYAVSTKVAVGDPAAMVQEESQAMDLVVVASHGRKGIDRFLMGSVSHAIVHHVTCPVLVIR
jgi:nucleotide-binding universal stress UspA family protein